MIQGAGAVVGPPTLLCSALRLSYAGQVGRRSFSDGGGQAVLPVSARRDRRSPPEIPASPRAGFMVGAALPVAVVGTLRQAQGMPPSATVAPQRDVPSGHCQPLAGDGGNRLLNLFQISIGFFEESAFAADDWRPGWPACHRAAKRENAASMVTVRPLRHAQGRQAHRRGGKAAENESETFQIVSGGVGVLGDEGLDELGDLGEDFPAWLGSAQLPEGDAGMMHTDLFSQLHLKVYLSPVFPPVFAVFFPVFLREILEYRNDSGGHFNPAVIRYYVYCLLNPWCRLC